MRAIGCDANGGYAAKVWVGRAQHEAAAEFQQTKLPTGVVANIEGRDTFAANLDCERRRDRRQ
jgi:hypothetical protein